MLAVKRSAGVAPEVNLRNPLRTEDETCAAWIRDEACKQVINPGFEAQVRCCQKLKAGVPEAPLKGLMSSYFFKRTNDLLNERETEINF